jgi:hypothetical protein
LETEENHKGLSEYFIPWPRFEPGNIPNTATVCQASRSQMYCYEAYKAKIPYLIFSALVSININYTQKISDIGFGHNEI